MLIRIILNPSANNWRAQKRIPHLRRVLTASALQAEIAITNGPKHALRLARESADLGFDAVIAAGGDGTINEVVNGLLQQAGDHPTLPLGILPFGTGNDLSDMLNLPRSIEQAILSISTGHTRQIDIGRVTFDGEHHYFDNNCAVAMEPLITAEYDQLGRLSGVPRYVAAVIKGLFKLRPWPMTLQWDDGSYDGEIMLCSVCNGPRTGSTFLMSPNAKVDDGLLDVVFVPAIPMHKVLRLVPRIPSGTHLDHSDVRYIQTRRLTITSHTPTPVHADGELISRNSSQIVYELLAGKLTLLGGATRSG